MIAYDPREWIRPVIDLHRSDSFRKALVPMCIMGALTALVVFIEVRWLRLPEAHPLRNVTAILKPFRSV